MWLTVWKNKWLPLRTYLCWRSFEASKLELDAVSYAPYALDTGVPEWCNPQHGNHDGWLRVLTADLCCSEPEALPCGGLWSNIGWEMTSSWMSCVQSTTKKQKNKKYKNSWRKNTSGCWCYTLCQPEFICQTETLPSNPWSPLGVLSSPNCPVLDVNLF